MTPPVLNYDELRAGPPAETSSPSPDFPPSTMGGAPRADFRLQAPRTQAMLKEMKHILGREEEGVRVVLLDADRRSIVETQVASRGLIGELIGAESLEAVYRGRGFVILAAEVAARKAHPNGIILASGSDPSSTQIILGGAVAVGVRRDEMLAIPPDFEEVSRMVKGWLPATAHLSPPPSSIERAKPPTALMDYSWQRSGLETIP